MIETKVFTDQYAFRQGKVQLADYLRSEQLETGYYVVFSNKHAEDDTVYFDDVIDGKQIVTYIIRTNFEQPSRRKPPPKTTTDADSNG